MDCSISRLVSTYQQAVENATMQLDSFLWHYFEEQIPVPLSRDTRLALSRDFIFAQPHLPYHPSANAHRPYVHAPQRQILR